ncbi:MAG: signal recognition particle-docking protein FtsY [Methylicorpusculum sp.]|uniref:signal recognition particle-docking protein FtsY n=1 Tax=Methylicorpusculum sp. TaxID=2713644 RepID=UPI00271E0364|nr:signal recognition particle-docking protein FtsY [Methylicorpusculum sp.]MDO8845951.1 signal recognition particle-docking protein FtsY [Methylicorpusculum sp.]MDO8938561.1 signal recognition particle-docking protein FtsY [Methylicorpusculum sp.]MDP2202111.1 signal recognition particle-docking protein FtsY [Methylicorpusculum sp.]
MFRKITFLCFFIALLLVIFGTYERLSDAGLGCPEGPGCHSQLVNPDDLDLQEQLPVNEPAQGLDIIKIWKEKGHFYLSGLLSVFAVILFLSAWFQSRHKLSAVLGATGILVLVALQTFTGLINLGLKVMPVIGSAHLVLGFLTVWMLFWLFLKTHPELKKSEVSGFSSAHFLSTFGILLLLLLIMSGIWVTGTGSGMACSGFPHCNGQWWPEADYKVLVQVLGGMPAGNEAQVAIHWLHRITALISFIVLSSVVGAASTSNNAKQVRIASLSLAVLLLLQMMTAAFMVIANLPLWAVSMHSNLAFLLMLPLIAIRLYSRYELKGEIELTQPKLVKAQLARVEPSEATYTEPEPESLYSRLKSQLQRTRTGLGSLLNAIPIGQKTIDDEVLEEIEANLLMADMGMDVTTFIINKLNSPAVKEQIKQGSTITDVLKHELLTILKPCCEPLVIPKQEKPFVILVVGVNGAGKTTTIGKMAKRLQAQGHSVMLAAGDTFRAAAVEQLQTWGERNKIHVVAQHTGADSASVIYDGLQSAQAKGVDVLIADTAGRLHTKSNLMDELKKVKRIMTKLDEDAPHEVLLVLDAGTGQNALSQARQFNETVKLSGIALTKLDGTAKGGIIFALAKQHAIPIRYIGIGEGIDDLQDFDAEKFVDALFLNDN